MSVFTNRSITIRSLDEATAIWIDNRAQYLRTSPEKVVLNMIRKVIESGRNGMELPVYHDLDALAGTWTDRDADDFLRTVSDFDKVDENLWG